MLLRINNILHDDDFLLGFFSFPLLSTSFTVLSGRILPVLFLWFRCSSLSSLWVRVNVNENSITIRRDEV